MSLKHSLSIVGALLVSACTGGLVSSWRAPDAEPLRVTNAKVVAIVMIAEEASRRTAEDVLAREISARGAVGVPMYVVLPEVEPSDEAAVRERLEAEGYEGVVVMRPMERTREHVTAPARFSAPYYHGFWGGYYLYGWNAPWRWGFYAPVEVYTTTTVLVETLVYSLRQNKLVWAGESEGGSPSNMERVITRTAAAAARELERTGLLAVTGG